MDLPSRLDELARKAKARLDIPAGVNVGDDAYTNEIGRIVDAYDDALNPQVALALIDLAQYVQRVHDSGDCGECFTEALDALAKAMEGSA